MKAFDIYYKNELMDTVFFGPAYDAGDVKDALVQHDNFPSNIVVQEVV